MPAAARDLEQADRAVGALDGEASAGECDVGCVGLQHMGGDLRSFLDDLVGGLPHHNARHAHRAAGMGAAADRNHVGVALDQADRFDRDAEPFRHALRKAGLVALAARQRADHDVDAAFRLHGDARVFARRAAGRLDVVGKPDAAQLPAPLGFAAALAEAVPVGQRQGAVHRFRVVAAVIGHAERIGIGLRRGGNEVAAPQLDAILSKLLRGEIDQPLDHEHRFRPAGAAIGIGRRRVAEHRAGAEMRGRHPIDRRSAARRT